MERSLKISNLKNGKMGKKRESVPMVCVCQWQREQRTTTVIFHPNNEIIGGQLVIHIQSSIMMMI